MTLNGHTDPVWSVAFGEGNVLASGSYDKSVKIWNAENGQLIRTLNGHTNSVISVAFGEGNVLASGSYYNSVNIWNISKKCYFEKLKMKNIF